LLTTTIFDKSVSLCYLLISLKTTLLISFLIFFSSPVDFQWPTLKLRYSNYVYLFEGFPNSLMQGRTPDLLIYIPKSSFVNKNSKIFFERKHT
jgi:hypothetical protein